jgi:hypothetical protein
MFANKKKILLLPHFLGILVGKLFFKSTRTEKKDFFTA